MPLFPRSTAPSCHSDASGDVPAGLPRVALVGSPNSGKSTLFNLATGIGSTVGNWPGTTVEVGRGTWWIGHGDQAIEVEALDLPGAYSLDARSPDEELTRDLILGDEDPPELVLVVTDAMHLSRSLYLVSQLREHRLRVVVALTMVDVAARRGMRFDREALAAALGCRVVFTDPRRRRGTTELGEVVREAMALPPPGPRSTDLPLADLDLADDRFAWVEHAVEASGGAADDDHRSLSDRIDRIATAPYLGMGVFLAAMWGVFQITTTVAAPLQDLLDRFFSGPVSRSVAWLLARVGLDGSWVEGLLVNGLVAGVGMLLTFVPVMTLMFLLLALLEDSGYLARAAVVTDRLMRRLGLPGQAFLPIIVGFGCNVPAIAATRILPHGRQRLLTALLVPFTSCSARLTVYVLLAATFFPAHAGTVVFAMYVVSILLVVLVGFALRATLWRTMPSDPLVIALPPYQRPTWRVTLAVTWQRLRGFLRTAGGIIVVTVCAVWLLQSIPAGTTGTFGHVLPGDSLYGAVARAVAPLFDPTGFGQWELVSALFVGFVAKEAVVSAWAQTYAVSEPVASHHPGSLGRAITESFDAASGGHPTVAAIAFMVFLLAYTPCVATLAAQKREIGWRWTATGVLIQLVVAWTLAMAIFQIGRVIV